MPDTAPPAASSPEEQALFEALAQLLAPVARLAVARGLPYAATEELLKRAFVSAASDAHPGLAAHRKVSRIATTTGINRREVTRLTTEAGKGAAGGDSARGADAPAAGRTPRSPLAPRSAANEISAHWRTHPAYRGADGQPLVLRRLGPAPSFEALAQEITRDVHSRSLLDELCRLGLAVFDAASDTVALQGDAFVPSGDRVRMLGFLGANVGDHLSAAVDNVLASGRPPHLEQALFADGLSLESLEALRPLLREQWAQLRQRLVPALEERIAADETLPGLKARVRLGLYAYHDAPAQAGADPARAPVAAKARRIVSPSTRKARKTVAPGKPGKDDKR
jgi:hypothetical protein